MARKKKFNIKSFKITLASLIATFIIYFTTATYLFDLHKSIGLREVAIRSFILAFIVFAIIGLFQLIAGKKVSPRG